MPFLSCTESLHEKDLQLKQTNGTSATQESTYHDVLFLSRFAGALEEKTRHVRHLESSIGQARQASIT